MYTCVKNFIFPFIINKNCYNNNGDYIMKKTKLICTIGPSSIDDEILIKMIKEGMDVARVNLSHSNHDFASLVVEKIRKINKKLNTNVGIMFDTKGPEIRVGTFKNGYIELKEGNIVTLTPKESDGTNGMINITHKNLSRSLDIESVLILDEGAIELSVIGIKNTDIMCKVIRGGILKDNKRINVLDTPLDIDFLSIADKDDILFSSNLDIDFLSLSFVRNANDVLDVNDILIGERNEHTQLISKIENQSAIDDIENIVKVSDGILVARGDLGVEIELEKLPCAQKMIVRKAQEKNKICIVATEMLSSMETKTRPTRAEVSDVANAVIDGVDAVMLSGETAIGNYPKEATATITKIIRETEKNLDYKKMLMDKNSDKKEDTTAALAYSTVDIANMINVSAIVTSTNSGYTARRVSSYRPNCPIIATTPDKKTATSLSLNWGIIPIVVKKFNSTDEIIENAKEEVKKPFAQELELNEKLDRLSELNALLNMDEKGAEDCLEEQEEADTSLSGKEDARTSIMEKLAQFKEQSSQMGIGNNKNREKAASL